VSVDTNVKGKNLAPYRKLRAEGVQIHITPSLVGLAESMRVVAKGPLGKSLKVEFQPISGQACDDGSCEI
jgi:hypothetical protein